MTVDLSEEDMLFLAGILGRASGDALCEGNSEKFRRILRLANKIGRYNPKWTGYEVPSEPPECGERQ